MDIKAAIEAIREEKRISKADMAKKLDMDPSNYNRLESRGEKLTLEQLQQIAKALEVTLIDLVSWNQSTPKMTGSGISTDLIARIQELEASIRDKSFIINTLNRNRQQVSIMFSVVFERYGNELNLGEDLADSLTEKQQDEKRRKKGAYITYGKMYSEDDVFQIIEHIFKTNSAYYFLLESLTYNNIILEDNYYANILMKYSYNIMKGKR